MQRGLLAGIVIATLLAVWWFGFHEGVGPGPDTSSLGVAGEATDEEEVAPTEASADSGSAVESDGRGEIVVEVDLR